MREELRVSQRVARGGGGGDGDGEEEDARVIRWGSTVLGDEFEKRERQDDDDDDDDDGRRDRGRW